MAAVQFVTHLPKEKYDSQVGWECSALSIPGSSVSRLVLGDKALTAEDFLVLGRTIRLADGIGVEDADATITLRRTLGMARSSAFLAVVAVIVALFAVASAVHSKPTARCVESR